MNDSALRVCLVDDHAVVREGFAALIGMDSAFEVVGQAGSCREALSLLERLPSERQPQLAIVDYFLPDGMGTELIAAFARRASPPAVLVMTSSEQDDTVFRALSAGARGYLLKSARADELFAAMRSIAGGGTWLSPSLRSLVPCHSAQALTDRERDIVNLLARGGSNEDIAGQLRISVATVKTHVYNLMQKLEARNRGEAAHKARRQGLIVDA